MAKIVRDPNWQEDINSYKSRPDTARPKWKGDSGAARDNAAPDPSGKSFKGQARTGGTVAPSADKSKAPRVSGGTTADWGGLGSSKKGQAKFGGTPSEGKSFKSQVKVQGTTVAPGKSYKGQAKVEGGTRTRDSVENSYRYVIRDH